MCKRSTNNFRLVLKNFRIFLEYFEVCLAKPIFIKKNKAVKISIRVCFPNNPLGQNSFTKILANQTNLYQVTWFDLTGSTRKHQFNHRPNQKPRFNPKLNQNKDLNQNKIKTKKKNHKNFLPK